MSGEIIACSLSQIQALAEDIADTLKGGDIVLLKGDLGAGKTTFAKIILKHLGITEEVVSPTFTIIQEYPISDKEKQLKKIAHMDAYRLENEQEFINIGGIEYLEDPHTLSIIEWPEKIKNILKDKKIAYEIEIKIDNEQKRRLTISTPK